MATAQVSVAISGVDIEPDLGPANRREPKKAPPDHAADSLALDRRGHCPLPCASPLRMGGAAVEHEHTEASVPSHMQNVSHFPPLFDTAIASETCGDDAESHQTAGMRLLETVHRIGDMQNCISEQLLRSHTELLEKVSAIHVSMQSHVRSPPQSPRCRGPKPSCESGNVKQSIVSDGASGESNGTYASSREVPAISLRDRQMMPTSPSKPHTRNTQAHTAAMLKHANLQMIRVSKQTFKSVFSRGPRTMLNRVLHRWNARRLLRSNGFDFVIGIVILMNSLCIGWEISADAEGGDSSSSKLVLQVLELFFLAIYCAELALRFYADGCYALTNSWVCFDCILVSSGLCATVIRNIGTLTANEDLQEAMKQVMLLRILRLLRLVRALRLVRQFKTLWRLVNGLLTSLDTMLSTFALMTLILYIAACIGVELIAGNDALLRKPEIAALVRQEFKSVPLTMLALVQFVTMDDLSDLYKPIIREQPLMFIYFVLILLIVSIALLNLVTAVLVEGALEKSRKDKEMEAINLRRQVKSYLPVARDLFQKMDTHGTGVLTLDVIQHKLEHEDDNEELIVKLKEIVPFESVLELFESLDIDGDGEIPEREFVDGVLKSALAGRENVELTQIIRLLRIQGRKIDKIESAHSLRPHLPSAQYYTAASSRQHTNSDCHPPMRMQF